MSSVSPNTTPPNPWAGNMDFAALRLAAISFLEDHNPTLWTDYNYHDPGVTILEQFCFALTDLAYRTDFDMADLLQTPNGAANKAFPGVFHLLNSFPVLKKDIAKVILDSLPGHGTEKGKISDKIYNAWVTSENNDGIFKVEVQLTSQSYKNITGSPDVDAAKKKLEKEIGVALGEIRGLCTDFDEIKILDGDEIHITGNVNIKNGYAPEKVLAGIYTQIDAFINPNVPFYTLNQLLEQGLSAGQIFEGPALSRGFILDDDLNPTPTQQIEVSDIEGIIFKTEGVSAIANISVNGKGDTYEVKEGCYPFLNTAILNEKRPQNDKTKSQHLEVSKNGARISPSNLDRLIYNTYLSEFNSKRTRPAAGQPIEKHFDIPARFRNVGKYYSIQKYFPAVYGIGDYGLQDKVFVNETGADTPQALSLRQAQAKQLKAYLMFFEQILANYLLQLGSLGRLFSAGHRSVSQTYFAQSIVDQEYSAASYNVPNGSGILDSFDKYTDAVNENAETPAIFAKRREMFLDHLLARVNEKIDAYPFTLYDTLYGTVENSEKSESKILAAKAKYLNLYDRIGYERNKAFNYYIPHTAKDPNISGLELKMNVLLGIENDERRELHKLIKFKIDDKSGEKEKPGSETVVTEEYFEEISEVEIIVDDHIVAEVIEEKDIAIIEQTSKKELTDENKGFRFENVTGEGVNAFFRNGMSVSNYRIGRHKNKNNDHEYFITFFNLSTEAEKHHWIKIHTHATEVMAKRKVGKLIAYVKAMNIRSEGLHLIEHVLLRDGDHQKISIVLPLWPARFQDTGFQEYVQQLFAKQAPLYAALNFVWLDLVYMKEFEELYFPWLKSLEGGRKNSGRGKSKELAEFLKNNSGKHRR